LGSNLVIASVNKEAKAAKTNCGRNDGPYLSIVLQIIEEYEMPARSKNMGSDFDRIGKLAYNRLGGDRDCSIEVT
jgi:hypothetical protein